MQVAVAGSVIFHTALLFLMAWLMGLDQTARALWAAIHAQRPAAVKEEPVVAMVFPDQIVPGDALKPKLSSLQKFVRTSAEQEAATRPERAQFTSDRNTVAASELAPAPGAVEPVPTMLEGERSPALELTAPESRATELTLSEPQAEFSPIHPLPARQVSQVIESLDRQESMAETNLDLEVKPALPKAAPSPVMQAREPDLLSPPQTQSRGSITNRGAAAVDAEATPTGRFMREVTSAVEKRWHELFSQQTPSASNAGYLKVRFYVNKEGSPHDLVFVEKIGNAVIEDLTLEAILKAEIPAMPKELLPLLEGERLMVEYDIVIQ
jgi:hypothetical protein